jgi:hypothetical protein
VTGRCPCPICDPEKKLGNDKYRRGFNGDSTIGTVDKHVTAMPAPKKGAAKKKAAPVAAVGEDGEKKPAKGRKAAAPMMPLHEPVGEVGSISV